MRYAISRYNREQTDLICKIYIAEALRESGRGYYLTRSLSTILGLDQEAEDRSAEEIIDDVIERLGA